MHGSQCDYKWTGHNKNEENYPRNEAGENFHIIQKQSLSILHPNMLLLADT